MQCLKCGKDTADKQVFCDKCLKVMDAYPVRSDTPIHLPKRDPQSSSKKQAGRKKPPTPEEQLAQLRHINHRLVLTLLCLALLLGVCSGMLGYFLLKPQAPSISDPGSGKNYTYSPD